MHDAPLAICDVAMISVVVVLVVVDEGVGVDGRRLGVVITR